MMPEKYTADTLQAQATALKVQLGWQTTLIHMQVSDGKKKAKFLEKWQMGDLDPSDRTRPWHRANMLALKTGQCSNVTVLDCDSAEAFQACSDLVRRSKIAEEKKLTILATRTYRDDGHHVFCNYHSKWKTGVDYLPGLDVRNDGGLIFLWPGVVDLLAKLRDHLGGQDAPIGAEPRKLRLNDPPETAAGTHQFRTEGADIGRRVATLVRLIGQWVSETTDDDEIKSWIAQQNAKSPEPLTDEEIRETVWPAIKRFRRQDNAHARENAEEAKTKASGNKNGFSDTSDFMSGWVPEETKEFIDGLIAPGLTVLAGREKVGKSFFSLQMCDAIAQGAPFLEAETIQSRCCYLSLEDNKNNLGRRYTDMELTGLFRYWTGPMEAVNATVTSLDEDVVIIDTGVRAFGSSTDYAEMHEILGPLQSWAIQNQRAVILVWHITKSVRDEHGKKIEPDFEQIQGSRALLAVADTILLLTEKKLQIRSRYLLDREIKVHMPELHWELGEAISLYERVAMHFKTASKIHTRKALCELTGGSAKGVANVLDQLLEEGRIKRVKRGFYKAV